MSGFIVFIVIVIAWSLFGSLKAAADRANKGVRPNSATTMQKNTFSSSDRRPNAFHEEKPRDQRIGYNIMKIEDRLTDFGDVQVEEKNELNPLQMTEPIEKKVPDASQLTTLFKGDRLKESIILAECLDRPRAFRPHPLNKQKNLLQRRG